MRETKSMPEVPYLIKGGMSVDARGSVSFVNEFNFSKIKRFYTVENSRRGEVRAWHGHKNEAKYVFVVSGEALVGAVKINNWNSPSRKTKVYRFLLSSSKPTILYIPKGYVNGFKSLTKDAKIIFFSTSTLAQSKNDDFRFDARYWDIWN